jgi:DNA-binding Lrp family transcriptional regulator
MLLNEYEAASIGSLLSPLSNQKSLIVLAGVMEGFSATEMAARYNLPRTTVHEYLANLVDSGYISKTEGSYTPTLLGINAMNWLVNRIKPCIDDYHSLLDIGQDLRNFKTVGDSIQKLSMETEEDEYIRGLDILNDLERRWLKKLQVVANIFS